MLSRQTPTGICGLLVVGEIKRFCLYTDILLVKLYVISDVGLMDFNTLGNLNSS